MAPRQSELTGAVADYQGVDVAKLTGERFGRWVVLAPSERDRYWLCRCDCGTEREVFGGSLQSMRSISCGCVRRMVLSHRQQGNSRTMTHGLSSTVEYQAWINMKARCLNPAYNDYQHYGGRGITVCAEWLHNFEAFYEHIGPRPAPCYSVDRIDVDGNYEPGNVRWATIVEQNNNTRRQKERQLQ